MNVKAYRTGYKTWLALGTALAILLAVLCPSLGLAQTGPNAINFQGWLLDGSGNPLDGQTRCVRFAIYDDPAAGTRRWPAGDYEYHTVTTASGTYKAGLFNVVLGETNPIPPGLLFDYDALYVGIGVSDDSTNCSSATYNALTPRSRLRANAYAQRSRRVLNQEADDAYLIDVENTGTGGGIQAKTDSTAGGNGAAAGYFEATATGSTGTTYAVSAQIKSTRDGSSAGRFVASASTGATYGVYVENISQTSPAAAGYFLASSTTGNAVGVEALNMSTSDYARAGYFYAAGSRGQTTGVYGVNNSTTISATAGYFEARGSSGSTFGVYGENDSSANGAYPIYADKTSCTGTASYCYGVATEDKMLAARFDTSASDVAEYYPTEQVLQPGDVVMAAPSGRGRVVRAEGAYTTAVLGVVSSGPGLALGSGEYEGGDGNAGKVPVTLTGRVPCKVSAENGPVRPGDLLTTAGTPGHAMRCEKVEHCLGGIIGKALDALESGTGTIDVLATLQ